MLDTKYLMRSAMCEIVEFGTKHNYGSGAIVDRILKLQSWVSNETTYEDKVDTIKNFMRGIRGK